MLDTADKSHATAAAASPPPRRRRWLSTTIFVLAVGAAITGGVMFFDQRQSQAKPEAAAASDGPPLVEVIAPARETKGRPIVLPGSVDAFYEAPIYARVSGYLKMWYQDIGAHVKAGQVLADIDTPELDEELAQAKSDLATTQANAALADLTAKRWKGLLTSQAVSQQAVDEKTGKATALRALVAASQSNVDRLLAMASFKRIVAPFDGVVTARKTDIGALINAGSGAGVELFKVADMHEMRVYVRVPQNYSSDLHTGITATLHMPQYPNRKFDATLATTSNAITKESRTVLVELMAANPDGALWPGTFAEVHFDLPPDPNILLLPANTLLFRKEGLQVAVVGPDNKVALKKITIGRDLGPEVEVTAGLLATDRVIDSPSDSLAAGFEVSVAKPDNTKTQPADVAGKKTVAGAAE